MYNMFSNMTLLLNYVEANEAILPDGTLFLEQKILTQLSIFQDENTTQIEKHKTEKRR